MIKIKDVEFKKLSEIDDERLFNFYSTAYPKRNNIIYKNWKWIYRTSLSGLEPIVAIYNKNIIGHAGLISTNILHNNKILRGIWFVDFYILSNFRNMGLGKVLTQKWMNLEEYHLTFCNQSSLRIFKKLDWVENKNYNKSCKLLNPLKWLPLIKSLDSKILDKINFFKYFNHLNLVKELSLLKVSDNKKILNDIIKSENIDTTNNITDVKILRDENWLNWRIFESPFINNYHFFLIQNSLIIVSIFKDFDKKKLNIIYTKYENDFYEMLLNKNILNWSIQNNVDIVWLPTNNIKKNIITSKFYKKNFELNFACNSVNMLLNKNVLKNISNLAGIDSDTDILNKNNNII